MNEIFVACKRNGLAKDLCNVIQEFYLHLLCKKQSLLSSVTKIANVVALPDENLFVVNGDVKFNVNHFNVATHTTHCVYSSEHYLQMELSQGRVFMLEGPCKSDILVVYEWNIQSLQKKCVYKMQLAPNAVVWFSRATCEIYHGWNTMYVQSTSLRTYEKSDVKRMNHYYFIRCGKNFVSVVSRIEIVIYDENMNEVDTLMVDLEPYVRYGLQIVWVSDHQFAHYCRNGSCVLLYNLQTASYQIKIDHVVVHCMRMVLASLTPNRVLYFDDGELRLYDGKSDRCRRLKQFPQKHERMLITPCGYVLSIGLVTIDRIT